MRNEKEIMMEIRRAGLFATTTRLMQERRAAMPKSPIPRYVDPTHSSRLSAGMCVNTRNELVRIANSTVIREERPIMPVTADAVDDEEIEPT
jgi:hypothetical protein